MMASVTQWLRPLLQRFIAQEGPHSTGTWSPRVARTLRRWQLAWGRQGLLAIFGLLLCPTFYYVAIEPAKQQLETERRNAAVLAKRMQAAGDTVRKPETPAEQLVEFYKHLPAVRALPDALERLVATADRHGVELSQGDYKLAHDKGGRMVRYQMTLPLKAAYPQIRRFLAALPEELPALALESVQIDRQKVADPVVEVKVRLVLFLEQN